MGQSHKGGSKGARTKRGNGTLSEHGISPEKLRAFAEYFSRWAKAQSLLPHNWPFHPLPYHLLDVGACAKALAAARPSLIAAMAKIAGITFDEAKRLFILMACLHDIGKYAAAFQSLDRDACTRAGCTVSASGLYSKKGGKGHVELGQWCWFDVKHSLFIDALGLPDADLPVIRLLGAAAFGHQGYPTIEQLLSEDPRLADEMMTTADVALAREFAIDVRRLVYGSNPVVLPATEDRAKRFSFLLAGAITVADALGSSVYFPFHEPALGLDAYWKKAKINAEQAISASGLTSVKPLSDPSFGALFPSMNPSPLQAFAWEMSLPGQFLLVVEDLMGSGKTEAALVVAARSLHSGHCDGVFLGLPTMTTADSQAARQVKDYRLLFAAGSDPSMTLAHSAALRSTILSDGNAGCAKWLTDDRRRRLLADMCVGTIDQALLAAMPTKFSTLRLFGLFSKLLIIDEVHAFDGYTSALIESLLAMHGALGGSALLLSATLTSEAKKRFCDAFSRAAGMPAALENEMCRPEYPLVTLASHKGVESFPVGKSSRAPRDRRVAFVRSEAQAEKAILTAAAEGCCVVWVRNTVNRAIASARSLAGRHNDVSCFHSRMPEADRSRRRTDLLERFGKDSTPETRIGGIVVATSIIEQSLDLDFDLVVVDLRPMDGILQAFGRGIRHPRDRFGNRLPDGERDQRPDRPMLVLSPDHLVVSGPGWYSDLLGTASFVFGDTALLWRTARALSEAGAVRYDNMRQLVAEAFSESDSNPCPACLLDAADKAKGVELAKRGQGKRVGSTFGPATGYVAEGSFMNDDVIPTRDGEATVEIVVVLSVDGERRPYSGSDFGTGLLRMPLDKFNADVIGNDRRETVKGYPGAYVVPVTRGRDNTLMHDGTVLRPFAIDYRFGMEWI